MLFNHSIVNSNIILRLFLRNSFDLSIGARRVLNDQAYTAHYGLPTRLLYPSEVLTRYFLYRRKFIFSLREHNRIISYLFIPLIIPNDFVIFIKILVPGFDRISGPYYYLKILVRKVTKILKLSKNLNNHV
jgi:hypothetical protein